MTKSRRGHGEGTITYRSDGRWAAAVSLPNGKRRWIYGRTRKEVSERMTAEMRELQRGILPPPSRLMVGDVLHQWLTEGARASVRASTYRSYSDIVRLHLIPEVGRIKLNKLEPADVERMLRRKLDSGLSPRRVQYIHAVLRRALGRAVRWGWTGRNVAALAEVPRVVQPEVDPLTPAEIRAFMEVIAGTQFEVLYITALGCGLRRGELLGLQWRDVDLEVGLLFVRRSLQRVSGQTLLEEPKSARSRRIIKLAAFLLAALRQHRELQKSKRAATGAAWDEQSFVFTTLDGRSLDGMNVTHHFQRLLAKAGIRRRRFHDLRHSCATLLQAKHVPPRVIMEILGHSQISVTMNTYTHVLPELHQEAADQMDGFFGSLGPVKNSEIE